MNRSVSVASTSSLRSWRPTGSARHSRVNSSITVRDAKLASVMSAILNEVVGPDMAGPLRPQPDARAIRQPQAPAPPLLCRNLQPLPPPDSLDPLGDPAVAIAAVALGQLDDVGGQ